MYTRQNICRTLAALASWARYWRCFVGIGHVPLDPSCTLANRLLCSYTKKLGVAACVPKFDKGAAKDALCLTPFYLPSASVMVYKKFGVRQVGLVELIYIVAD